MASVRKAMLQEKVFAPKGEKLVHVMQVRTSEENEEHCLCIAVTRDEEVMIVYLKVPANGLREKCRRQEVWYLEDLVLVDGRDATKDNPHLDMHFQTLCTWEASSTAAKYTFVRSLKKTNKLYLQKDIQFVNFDSAYIQETGFFGVPEDTILVIQLCLQAFNCICLLGSL
ncbi:exocyst complex component 1-like [Callorhinchus milii]|uniref:Exocyst complex component 1-like n=2 Tax=Callorhinchus milii TaxID=7868 RepID=A0A4W3JHH7_CALMI|nr:exocyst complex component 1-like [Callorhinchus milii]|eukprot:gi/632967775/ref/XP_007900167.1/ PREDICTED: exocyst complex component 1-like [Callorhinchus milii]